MSVLPQNEGYMSVLPQNEVFVSVLPQIGVFEMGLVQTEINTTVLFRIATVDYCQWFNRVKTVVNFVLNPGVNRFKFLPLTLVHCGKKLGWTIRISLESLRYALKMYTWSLSENQASVWFRCRLIGLLLKQSLFRKHDFAVLVHKVYYGYQNLCFENLKFFPRYKNDTHTHIKEEHTEISSRYQFHGGGKALLFSFNELIPYASTDLCEQQYQFLQVVKTKQKQSLVLNDGDVLCSVPLNILAPKMTLKTAKELANLHDMYMPSKILLKNAQILLESHKCETGEDLLAVFRPYKVVSNPERQQTWYQKNKEKRAEYDKYRSSKSEYQESHNKSSQKHYWSKKDVKFPPDPPSCKDPSHILFSTFIYPYLLSSFSPFTTISSGCTLLFKQ